MSIVQVQLPDSLQKQLVNLAQQDGITVDQFIVAAVSEKLSALMATDYLEERARKGSRAKYEALLATVPDSEPEAQDRLSMP